MILRNFVSLRAFTVYMENSLRFEISLRSIWPKWNLHQSEFYSTRSHVNATNEVTSYRSQILSRSEISNRFEFTLGLMLTCSKIGILKVLQISQKNNCVGASFSREPQAVCRPETLLKILPQAFPVDFVRFLRTPIFKKMFEWMLPNQFNLPISKKTSF